MKLSETKTTNLLRVLVYGEPGVGKTCFAAGFPTPILYLDFDNKVNSAARFYAADKTRLDEIEVINLSPEFARDSIIKFQSQIANLAKWQSENNYPYKTLVLDSLTTFSKSVLEQVLLSNPASKRFVTKVGNVVGAQPAEGDYGILLREFERVIPNLLTLNMNIVMLGHLDVKPDKKTGEMLRQVMFDGSFGKKVNIYFDEVYYAYIKTENGKREYLAQTQGDGVFKCRSSIPGLPNPVALDYAEIARFIK